MKKKYFMKQKLLWEKAGMEQNTVYVSGLGYLKSLYVVISLDRVRK